MPKMKQSYPNMRHALLLALLLWIIGCASTAPAPVKDLSSGRAEPTADSSAVMLARDPVHTVRRGDTLYSIAFRNGVDYRDLAARNSIGAPYTIHVGQQIKLDLRPRSIAGQAGQQASGEVSTAALTDSVAARSAPSAFEPLKDEVVIPTLGVPETAAPPEVADSAPPPGTVRPAHEELPPTDVAPIAIGPSPAPMVRNAATATVANIRWQWPADGTMLKTFVVGDQSRRGVDIAGKSGDPVHAAADGVVVYSGNGLIGYGELVIIKHDDTYLSAYGHNRTRLVAEGARVQGGQLIAEMGSTASRQMLHFEIRKNGKPVNPLDFLPRR